MLSSSQLNRYFSDGFLLVENLLSEEEVDQFLVSQDQNKNKNYNSYGLKRFVVDDSWSRLANHKKIVSIVTELIDGDPRIVQTMYMNKQPKGGTGTALHQDTHYIKNEPNTLMACWIALSIQIPKMVVCVLFLVVINVIYIRQNHHLMKRSTADGNKTIRCEMNKGRNGWNQCIHTKLWA